MKLLTIEYDELLAGDLLSSLVLGNEIKYNKSAAVLLLRIDKMSDKCQMLLHESIGVDLLTIFCYSHPNKTMARCINST